uniref:Cell adhesion molecule-related/down-regulated by oncogenes-like n=1 Tax=Phallusia mammillata TaxID=59560 RepID=A0A6F9D9Q3_9ASCI|nr:cell adhesion molecule-related/down-regulated by oncogenes-like [Phallusia mammillata]
MSHKLGYVRTTILFQVVFLICSSTINGLSEFTQIEPDKAVTVFQDSIEKSGEPLIINSHSHTLKCTSYILSWKSPQQSQANRYYIRYKQALVSVNASKEAMAWRYVTLPGNITQHAINDLNKQSIYQVEIICGMQNSVYTRPVMSSFRTGCQNSVNSGGTVSVTMRPLFGPENVPQDVNKVKVPEAPTLTANGISQSALTLSWLTHPNDDPHITEFKIEMRISGKGKNWREKVSHIEPTVRIQNITGLKKGLGYKFRIIAISDNGKSAPSHSVKFFTTSHNTVHPPLNPPEMLHVEIKNASYLCIQVEDLQQKSDIEGYFIRLVKNNVVLKPKHASVNKNGICVTLVFKPELQYSFQIQSYNVHGRSPYSEDIFFKLPTGYKSKVYTILNLASDGSNVNDIIYNNDGYNAENEDSISIAQYSPLGEMSQRDIAILIAGLAMVLVIIVLVISAIIYNRMRIQEKKSNGACVDTKLPSKHYPPSPNLYQANQSNNSYYGSSRNHDEICRQHAPACRQFNASPYLDEDFQHCGSRTAPLWWVRGVDGEFCHIVPKDATRGPNGLHTARPVVSDQTVANIPPTAEEAGESSNDVK